MGERDAMDVLYNPDDFKDKQRQDLMDAIENAHNLKPKKA